MNQPRGPVRLVIHGASGRMGQELERLAGADPRFEICARLDSHSAAGDLPQTDVVVDFSGPAGLRSILASCRKQGVALVSGTTGLEDELLAALAAAGQAIPVLHAANFSLGVAVLTRLLSEAAAWLPDWQLEIIEAHHAAKRDAPSGTALALGQAAARARGQELAAVQRAGRHGQGDGREDREIGFASVRAADIVGEHTALLATLGERIELSHRATDRAIFARGALHAAAWLAGQGAGHYTLADMLTRSQRQP